MGQVRPVEELLRDLAEVTGGLIAGVSGLEDTI
jgi:hypothetical protein